MECLNTENYRGYTLSPEDAAALRVQPIAYPCGRVPVAIVVGCLEPESIEEFKVVDASIAIVDVLRYLGCAVASVAERGKSIASFSEQSASPIKLLARPALVFSEC